MERRDRLRDNKDFKIAYKYGKQVHNRDFAIIIRKNGLNRSRFGFSISKKIGKAHIRNYLKRRLREIIRLNIDKFPKGYDLIVIPRPRVLNMTYKKLEASLLHCISKFRG